MELEVRVEGGKVHLKPLHYLKGSESSIKMIVRIEALLSTMHLQKIDSKNPYEDLKAYFKQKGWEIREHTS